LGIIREDVDMPIPVEVSGGSHEAIDKGGAIVSDEDRWGTKHGKYVVIQ
jgi:hypothetical protein